MSDQSKEQLLTPKQLSEWLQIKPSTVYKWTHYGFIPHVKLGGAVRFDRETVESWIKRRSKRGRNSYKLDEDKFHMS